MSEYTFIGHPVSKEVAAGISLHLKEWDKSLLRIRQLEAAVAALSEMWEMHGEPSGRCTAEEIIQEAIQNVK